MLKFWAKTISEQKITRDLMYKKFEKYTGEFSLEHLIEICHELDIPTPILTKTHINHLAEFNVVRFKGLDFVESIDFDYLMIENCSD